MKTNNYKKFPFLALMVCMLMISSFAADRQIKNKKSSVIDTGKIKTNTDSCQSTPILALYVLNIWRT